MKMFDQELKAKWVEALRSGRYTQTRGTLHQLKAVPSTPVGYCCLGVLCDIHPDVTEQINLDISVNGTFYYNEVPFFGDFTTEFERAIGLQESEENDLITMNDIEKRSFAEIADWIEQYL